MGICSWCKNEMSGDHPAITCAGNSVVKFPDGIELESVPYQGNQCVDCNVTNGGKHHPGCDMERCPKCNGQLISCGCLDEEEEEEEKEEDEDI